MELRTVDVMGGAVRTAGIIEAEQTDQGIVFHRLPAWARPQHTDVALPLIETMPSGGRLEMITDATCLELDVDMTLLRIEPDPIRPACFEVVIDGESFATQSTQEGTLLSVNMGTGGFDFVPGSPTTIRFDDLPAGTKRLELWLHQGSILRLLELRANGDVQPAEPIGRRWVHYGSSISHCLEADRPTGVWPVVAARLAGVDLMSFGLGGQCHLDPFAARMIAAQPADLISLKLGINVVNGDTMRERTFVPALHGLLDTIREAHPDVPVVLVTPITCPVAEDHPGPTLLIDGDCVVIERPERLAVGSLTLRRIRQIEADAVAARQAAGDANLHLLQGTELFGPDDVADLPDGLHPNSAGYRRMGERFHKLIFENGPFRG